MIDLNHPLQTHVFAAARIEDQIRFQLLRWLESLDTPTPEECSPEVLSVLIPQLYQLNARHFEGSAAINRTIVALRAGVQSGDAQAAWGGFLKLAERQGDNFGTWAI